MPAPLQSSSEVRVNQHVIGLGRPPAPHCSDGSERPAKPPGQCRRSDLRRPRDSDVRDKADRKAQGRGRRAYAQRGTFLTVWFRTGTLINLKFRDHQGALSA